MQSLLGVHDKQFPHCPPSQPTLEHTSHSLGWGGGAPNQHHVCSPSWTYKSHGKPGNLVVPTPPPLKGVTKGNTLRKSVSVKTKLQFFKPATGKMAGSNATSYTRSLCSIMVIKDPASEKKDPFHSRIRLFWLILSCDYILSRSVSIWLFNDGLPWLGSSWTGPDSKAAVHTKIWEWGENKKVFLIISLPSLIILPITVLKQKVHWEYSERRWTGAIFDLDK